MKKSRNIPPHRLQPLWPATIDQAQLSALLIRIAIESHRAKPAGPAARNTKGGAS